MEGPASPVLFVTRKWAPAVGGMETWSHRMAEELARLRPVRVVALPGRAGGHPPSAARLLLFPLKVMRALASMRPRPGVLHLGDMALWPLALLAGRRVRVVLSAHGTDVSYHRRGGVRGHLYGWYLRLGAALLASRVTVVANSHATAAVAAETGWTADRVVPLGTDYLPGRVPAEAEPGAAILFAGRLIAQKGCGWFVREVLPRLGDAAVVRIAGTVWDQSEAWLIDHPQVEFLGPLDRGRLDDEYARASCVILPNIRRASGEFEGFGLVACEAAAAGGVVLAARTGGLTDAVIDGETGLLLPPGDAAAWATAIEQVRAWPAPMRAEFVGRSTTSARAHFAWPRVARETAEAYHG